MTRVISAFEGSLIALQQGPFPNTIKIVCFGTESHEQTVQTQIRLPLRQSDQDLHCLPLQVYIFWSPCCVLLKTTLLKFQDNNSNNFRCPSTIFMVKLPKLSHIMRKPAFAICKQQSRRSACASAQSDQRLCFHCLDSIISQIAIAEISRL